MQILEDLFKIQEEIVKPNGYSPESRQHFFSNLGECFKLVPCVTGIYAGPKIEKPSYPETKNDIQWENYRKYKKEVNKLKATIGSWDTTYKIEPQYDKYALMTGRKFLYSYPTSSGKSVIVHSCLVVDIDDLQLVMKYNSVLQIETWNPTFTVKTGNGWHLIYLCPPNPSNLNSARFKELGLDIRANGGYIIAPVSIHPGTHTYYEILKGKINNFIPEATLELSYPPQIILDLSCKTTREQTFAMVINSSSNGNWQPEDKIYSFGPFQQLNNFSEIPNDMIPVQVQNENENTVPVSLNQNSPFSNVEIDYATNIQNKINGLDHKYQKLIYEGNPSDRSNASFFMKVYLISQGFKHDEIKLIFETFKIGDKDKEKSKYNYFEHDYVNALEHYHRNTNNKLLLDPSSNQINDYGSITLLELMDTKLNYPMIINPFLMKQTKLLLCAEKGTCKSHLALQMILELLNPQKDKFLDTFPIDSSNRPKSILYINGENSIYELQMKIEGLCRSLQQSDYKNILTNCHLMTKKDFCTFNDRLDNDYFIKGIKKRIIEDEAEFLVIDNLQCFNKGEENDNSNMRVLLDNLTPIITEFDIPFMLVHHSSKQSTPDNFARGASSIGDWCSHALYIQKLANGLKLHNPKSRTSAPFPPVELVFNNDILTPVTGNQSSSSNFNGNQIITEVMKQHNNKYDKKGDLKSAVKNHLAGIGISMCSSRIESLITNAVNSGILKEVAVGKSNQKSYELA